MWRSVFLLASPPIRARSRGSELRRKQGDRVPLFPCSPVPVPELPCVVAEVPRIFVTVAHSGLSSQVRPSGGGGYLLCALRSFFW